MADNEVQALILQELRGLQRDFARHAQATGERLAALEQGMKTAIVGNGAKSRLTIVEEHVDSLRQWRWRVIGISAGVSSTVCGIAAVLFHLTDLVAK